MDTLDDVLMTMGANPALSGYKYAKTAIYAIMDEPKLGNSLMKGLYVDVAQAYHTKPLNVERAIRHLVERTFIVGDDEALSRVFKGTVSRDSGKVSNGTFLVTLADYMRDIESGRDIEQLIDQAQSIMNRLQDLLSVYEQTQEVQHDGTT